MPSPWPRRSTGSTRPRALTELARVLRPGGGLALLWNERGRDASLGGRAQPDHALAARARPVRARPRTGRSCSAADGRLHAARDGHRFDLRAGARPRPAVSTGWPRAATSRPWPEPQRAALLDAGPALVAGFPAALRPALRRAPCTGVTGAPARRPDLGRAGAARPPLAPHPRPVGDPRQRGDAPADAGAAGRSRATSPSSRGSRPAAACAAAPVGDGGGRVGRPRVQPPSRAAPRRGAAVVRAARWPLPASVPASSSGCPASGPTRPGQCWPSPSRHDVAVVDTNVARVLARVQGRRLTARRGAARRPTPRWPSARRGRGTRPCSTSAPALCRPARPACEECPLAAGVRWHARRPPRARPGAGFGRRQRRPVARSTARTARAGAASWPPCGAGRWRADAVDDGDGLAGEHERAARVAATLVADGLATLTDRPLPPALSGRWATFAPYDTKVAQRCGTAGRRRNAKGCRRPVRAAAPSSEMPPASRAASCSSRSGRAGGRWPRVDTKHTEPPVPILASTRFGTTWPGDVVEVRDVRGRAAARVDREEAAARGPDDGGVEEDAPGFHRAAPAALTTGTGSGTFGTSRALVQGARQQRVGGPGPGVHDAGGRRALQRGGAGRVERPRSGPRSGASWRTSTRRSGRCWAPSPRRSSARPGPPCSSGSTRSGCCCCRRGRGTPSGSRLPVGPTAVTFRATAVVWPSVTPGTPVRLIWRTVRRSPAPCRGRSTACPDGCRRCGPGPGWRGTSPGRCSSR